MPFLTQGKTNWKYILIVLILAIIVGGGILSYLRYFKREISSLTQFPEIKKLEKPVVKKLEVYSLKSLDGFSIEVYRNEELIREITKDEIIKEWLKKHGGKISLFASKEEYWSLEEPPGVCGFEGGCSLADSFVNKDSIDFIYDSQHRRIILPITFVKGGHMVGWDFYVLDLSKNQFYIVPGERISSIKSRVSAAFTTQPFSFIISPNNHYLAYVYGYAGGTCTYRTFPAIIDLEKETFPYDEKITEKIIEAIEEDWKKFVIDSTEFVPAQILPEVKDISWDLNNNLNVIFTSWPCGDIWDHLVPNAPESIEKKLYLEPFLSAEKK